MHFFQIEIALISCLVAIACALPGLFLVLNGTALMSDAISHAILPGIVIIFLIVKQLESPLLLLGAICAGLLTVIITQLIIHTQRLKKDAAIGLVFPLFFSIGVILISKYARNVHLDTDMVLLGELAFAPFHRITYAGYDLGPYSLWLLLIVVIINSFFVYFLKKELLFSIFDAQAAHMSGFYPQVIYYALMTITSITTVTAFDSVGSLVVVALMIAPAATACLLCDGFSSLLKITLFVSVFAATAGYIFAAIADLSIAGSIATINGIIFLYTLLCAPNKGIVVQKITTSKREKDYSIAIICQTLAKRPQTLHTIVNHLQWQHKKVSKIVEQAINKGLIISMNDTVKLSISGHKYIKDLFNKTIDRK